MFLYKVGYTSYEECPEIHLFHHRKIFQPEFDEMCLSCAELAVRESLARDDYSSYHFSDIYERVASLMIERHGFVRASYAGDFRPFGWASMFDKGDWKRDRDADLDKLSDRMLSAGLHPVKSLADKVREEYEASEALKKDQSHEG